MLVMHTWFFLTVSGSHLQEPRSEGVFPTLRWARTILRLPMEIRSISRSQLQERDRQYSGRIGEALCVKRMWILLL